MHLMSGVGLGAMEAHRAARELAVKPTWTVVAIAFFKASQRWAGCPGRPVAALIAAAVAQMRILLMVEVTRR